MADKGILICQLNMFTLNPTIYMLSEGLMSEVGVTSRETLAEDISSLCEKFNLDDVLLIGPEAHEYEKRIHTYTLSKFGVRNLNVEVKQNV